MAKIAMRDLLEAGVHFGHPTKRWNPKMKPFIYGARNGIYIFDLPETMRRLQEACEFLYNTVCEGGTVLFVGTKRQAQDAVRERAEKLDMFHMTERWLGGTLTNNQTIRRSIARMKDIERMEETGELDELPKKEASRIRRELSKLQTNLSGISEMRSLPDAMFVVDIEREEIAVREANRLDIPVVAMVDTNCDPDPVDYVIPANDDALRSIKIVLNAVETALDAAVGVRQKALEEAAKKAAEEAAKKAEAAAARKKEAEAKREEEKKAKAEAREKAKKAQTDSKKKADADKPKADSKKADKKADEKKTDSKKADSKKAKKKTDSKKADDKKADVKKADKKADDKKADDKKADDKKAE